MTRKFKLFSSLFLTLVLGFTLIACGTTTYTVTFDTDGGSTVEAVTVEKGATVTKPEDPTKDGFDFVVWQLDGEEFEFTTPIKKDITLKATWKVKDSESEIVTAIFTVTLPAGTPEGDIYIAGDFKNDAMAEWDPAAASGKAVRDGLTATIEIDYDVSDLPVEVNYKWTRGSLETVEKTANGEELENRVVTITKTSFTFNDTVATWADDEEEAPGNLGLPVVEGAITIASFRETEPEDATIVGVVTSLAPYNSFSIEDETGSVALRISESNTANIDFKVGDAIEARVKYNVYNDLVQAEVIESTYTVHEGTYDRLPNVDLNTVGLAEADLLPLQNRTVNLSNVKVVSKSGTGSLNVVVALETEEITIRWDNRVESFDNTVMQALNPGDTISIVGATLAWFNNAQIMVDQTEQLVLEDAVETVTVTFNTNGGNVIDSVTLIKGETLTLPGAPIKEGFVFAGWFTDEDLTVEFVETDAIEAGLTLYAKWEETEALFAVLQYEAGSGTINMTEGNNAELVGLDPLLFEVLDTPRQLPNSQHIGLNNAGQIRIYGHASYVGKNTLAVIIAEGKVITNIEITYLAGSNNPSSALLVLGDEELILTAEDIVNVTKAYSDLSIDGFSIRNTQDGGTGNSQIFIEKIVITYEDGTATSTFTPIPVLTVTQDYGYDIEDGALYYEPGDAFTLPADPVREGFNFEGWFTDAEFTTPATDLTEITKAFTIYAKWEAATSTVTFDTDGGSEVAAQEVAFGEMATEPAAPTKEGFVFLGWFLEGAEEVFDFSTTIEEDITLVAKWELAPNVVRNETQGINYTTIQAAIDAANNNDIILVAEGTYAEQITINEPLSLIGPNAEVLGTNVRDAEAILTLPAELADGYYPLVYVHADNVVIEGFKLFEDVSVAYAAYQTVGVEAHGNNVIIRNNIFDGFNRNQLLITSQTFDTETEKWVNVFREGALVEGNFFVNSKDYTAIYLQGTAGVVQNNVVENAAYRGIQIQPYSQALDGSVLNNEVQAGKSGLYYNSASAAGSWLFEDNIVTAADLENGEEWYGISIQGFIEGSEVVTFRDIIIDGSEANRNAGILTIGVKSFTTFEGVATFENITITNVNQEYNPSVTEFTVTFDSAEGSLVDPVTVIEGGFAVKPADPTKEGFNFLGWFLGTEETPFDFATRAITEDITLVAKWEEEVILEEVIVYETDFEDVIKGSYAADEVTINDFIWNLDDSLVGNLTGDKKNGTKSVRLKGFIESKNSFDSITKVVFYAANYGTNKGGIIKVEVSSNGTNWEIVGEEITLTADLIEYTFDVTKSGPLFVKITKTAGDRTNIDDLRIYGIVTPLTDEDKIAEAKANLEIDLMDNTSLLEVTSNLELPVLGLNDASITWASSNEAVLSTLGVVTPSAVDETITLTATITLGELTETKEFTVKVIGIPVYTVTINYGYEIADDVLEYTENDAFTLPADPVRDGFIFTGWFTDAEYTTPATDLAAVTESFTIYAKWADEAAETVLVTFDTDGGNVIDPVSVVKGEILTLPAEPTKSGFTFAGWFLGEATEAFDFATPITEDITLVAHWEPQSLEQTVYMQSDFGTTDGWAAYSLQKDKLIDSGILDPNHPTTTSWNILGGNVNNSDWDYIRMGGKDASSILKPKVYLETNFTLTEEINQIIINIVGLDSATGNEIIHIQTSTNQTDWTTIASKEITATGDLEINDLTIASGNYIRFVFERELTSQNRGTDVKTITFYTLK